MAIVSILPDWVLWLIGGLVAVVGLMPWLAAVAVLSAIAGGLGWLWWQQAHELARLRERYASERSSHYRTWTLLMARERQIGRLGERLRGLEEIAAASSIGAQLYQAMMADIRSPVRGEDLGQDGAISASPASSAQGAHL